MQLTNKYLLAYTIILFFVGTVFGQAVSIPYKISMPSDTSYKTVATVTPKIYSQRDGIVLKIDEIKLVVPENQKDIHLKGKKTFIINIEVKNIGEENIKIGKYIPADYDYNDLPQYGFNLIANCRIYDKEGKLSEKTVRTVAPPDSSFMKSKDIFPQNITIKPGESKKGYIAFSIWGTDIETLRLEFMPEEDKICILEIDKDIFADVVL
ncbi:MAG: hypothetical protein QME46_11930 [Thermoanaerobacteraceae bacterium]|nr:hypothetical protein [Thermoanaerobacteraceae bacterium]